MKCKLTLSLKSRNFEGPKKFNWRLTWKWLSVKFQRWFFPNYQTQQIINVWNVKQKKTLQIAVLESHVLLLLSCAFTMESCIAIGCSFHCSLALLRYSLYGFLFLLSLPFSRLEPKFNSLSYYYHTRFLFCTSIWISFECILLSLFDSIHPSISLCFALVGSIPHV